MTILASPALLAAEDTVSTAASSTQLVIAALVSIALIIALIVWFKLHAFLSLMIGSAVMAAIAGIGFSDTFTAFSSGVGSTVGSVGVLIALGAIIGKILIETGGADQIVDTLISKSKPALVPWAMAIAAFAIGIPLFFEVGVVLLIPIVMIVARRVKMPIVLIGIPALAGLSALHGLIPPHPGPLIAIDALHANLGMTLGFGLIVALPVVAISGPLLARPMARWVPRMAPDKILGASQRDPDAPRPSFGASISIVLLPVVLMLLSTIVETTHNDGGAFGTTLTWIGTPLQALLITTIVAIIVLGFGQHHNRSEVSSLVGASFGPIAGILLIVAAGGGFKETLVESGVGDVVSHWIEGTSISVLLAGWLVAVLIRVATGSATVATITAAGIMAPLASNLTTTHDALLVLAIGAGSVFLSHVNDAGFWLVKEYFGMTVGETFKTWSLMECAVSVIGLGGVSLLGLIV